MSARHSGKPLWLIGPVGGMRVPFTGTFEEMIAEINRLDLSTGLVHAAREAW